MYFRQYVIEKIPKSLHALMPINPQGNFRYEDPDSSKYITHRLELIGQRNPRRLLLFRIFVEMALLTYYIKSSASP